MTGKSSHRLSSKLMLAAIILATLGLVALCIVAAFGMPTLGRGSAGPLVQSSPRADPAPLVMRRKKAP